LRLIQKSYNIDFLPFCCYISAIPNKDNALEAKKCIFGLTDSNNKRLKAGAFFIIFCTLTKIEWQNVHFNTSFFGGGQVEM